ncbi:molybdate ABC transporter substrate-binding protein [Anaeromicropila herbilytica]|uniref:Putative ABC transporter substrate-binding lipoprotein YvgL n=1 Tax=Anaeromicropila herbilytica TaxID=2785025 RepID=A0A7R7IG98_9FIRM|nr:molybdate ABC transporter substrate-binding protein [Anaeromicropila herbilytica]BCN32873.1 putative ABC transporter substrate-binding lipoprotein YvgL [Anaeromicropila herbilytica]
MKKGIKLVLIACLCVLAFSGCKKDISTKEASATNEKGSNQKTELIISAAASLQNAMEEIKTLYEAANKKVTLNFNFGSSGALQQQIEQGAPADVFISAAEKQMATLKGEELMVDNTISILLKNKVVLIVPKDSTLGITSFDDILKAKVIALGDPASVPAGQYAEQVFKSLDLLEKVQKQATYGKDVTEVLAWVRTGNADAGVVYQTDAQSSKEVKVVAEAPEGSHDDVIYPIGVVRASKEVEAAKAFLDYLKTDEAMKIFEKYGFINGQ